MWQKTQTIFAVCVFAATVTSFVQSATFEPHPRHHHRPNHHNQTNGHQHNRNHNHHHRHNTLDLSAADKPSKRLAAEKSHKTLPLSASVASFNALSSTSAVATATAMATGENGSAAYAAAVASSRSAPSATDNDTSTKPLKLLVSNAFDRDASPTKLSSSSASLFQSRHTTINQQHSWPPPPSMGSSSNHNALNSWNYNPMIGHHPQRRSGGGEMMHGWPADVESVVTPTTPPVTYRPYVATTKEHRGAHPQTKSAGRHICNVAQPIPDNRVDFNKLHRDFWRSNDIGGGFSNELPHHRPSTTHLVQKCCDGWTQMSRNSNGCTKPVCRTPCANGGKCVRPDVCQCPAGFDGKYCETDRNECAEQKPCDQHCYNTFGSYYCTCRDGFVLLADRESCRRAEAGATAFEARDMENDVEPDFSDKIRAIENKMQAEKRLNEEMSKKFQFTVASVQSLKTKLESFEQRQPDVSVIRDKLYAQEAKYRKLEYIVDQLYKCRSRNSIFCTLQ